MPYHKRAGGGFDLIGGFVGVIGPKSNPNYFTGSGYTSELDDAKVFRTPHGCFAAMRYWQEADYNRRPLLEEGSFWQSRRAVPVRLQTLDWEIVPQ